MAYQEEEASGRITELEQENRKMKQELEEFRAESSHLKNQQATVRRLEERNRQLEHQMEEKVKEMVAMKQQVMAEESQKSTETLKERKHQLHEQLRTAKESVQRMQKMGQIQVFDQLFDELFDLRAKSEEHRGAKETEVELLTDEVDRAEARLTALEREKENLKAQLAAVGSRQDEDLLERSPPESSPTFEASLSAKEKIISELHTELHALEVKLKANRGLNAKKKGVDQRVSRVSHGSASELINAVSTDEAAGHRGMKGTRKSVSEICAGDGGGWRCKQDGPFRFKKVKQLQELEHVGKREALIRCPNKPKELESRRAPSQQVDEEGGGWEVGPTTVFRKRVVDSEAQQNDGGARCGTSPSRKNEVSRDGKESSGMGRAPVGREGTGGASRIKGFGVHGAQSCAVQGVESSEMEVCGGGRGVFERHQSASSAPEAAEVWKEKQLKWVRTWSSNVAESDTHEDFLSTPQQKALSALSDRCRGGVERGRLEAIEEQICGSHNSSREDFGTGVEEKLCGNSGNHDEAPHNNDKLHEKRCRSSESGGEVAGCVPEAEMHRGRVVMKLVSRDARGRVGRCVTEECKAEPHEWSGERDGEDVRVTNLKNVGSDAARVGQAQVLRLLGQKAAPAYKYNAPVRKKGERELLVGVQCKQCEQFYKAVQAQDRDGIAENRCEHFQGVSKHRYFFPPPATPDGFWDIGFDTDGQNNE